MKLRYLTLAGVGWFLLLVTLHYFNQRPLWLDEGYIFTNITQHDTPQKLFTQPPLMQQAFPRFYLYLVQQLSKSFDFHLLALRFLPFMAMIGGFLLWLSIARREFKDNEGLLTFVACWSASIPLIYYGAELKQYSMDVCTAALFVWFIYYGEQLRQQKPAWVYVALLAVLPLAGLFSYPVFLFMVFPFYNLLRLALQEKKCWHLVGIYVLSGCMVTGFLYWFDIRVSNADCMQGAHGTWSDYFISFDSVGEFFRSLGEGINNLISRWFAEKPKWIRAASRIFIGLGFLQMLISFFTRFKKEGFRFTSVHSVAFVVFIEMLILAVLKKYPFTVPRTSLYFAPVLLCLTTVALMNIKVKWPVVYRILHSVFLVYLLYVSVGIARCILSGDLGAQSVLWQ